MPIRSAVLARISSAVGGSNGIISTVPANETWILKEVDIDNTTGGNAIVSAWAADPSNTQVGLAAQETLAAGALGTVACYLVLDPGSTLNYFASVGPVHFWYSGIKLDGVAA